MRIVKDINVVPSRAEVRCMSTPPKQQRLVLKGEATPQLTELLLQGWMVLGREGGVWTLERLSPSLLALPSSRREASRG